jgi:hypothetical protein
VCDATIEFRERLAERLFEDHIPERARGNPGLSQERIRAMRRLMLQTVTTIVLSVSVLIATPTFVTAQSAQVQGRAVIRRPIPLGALNRSLDFARTELFFGTAKPEGAVTEEEFLGFLDSQITPRFPDGLTLLKGDGQFRGEDGVIIKEDSFVLILLYPLEGFTESSRKINAIRRLYKEAFQQESVLRVDEPFAVRVSF